jgi:hypothetical protein
LKRRKILYLGTSLPHKETRPLSDKSREEITLRIHCAEIDLCRPQKIT